MDITDAPKKLTLSAKGPNLEPNGKETAIYIAEVFLWLVASLTLCEMVQVVQIP